MEITNFSYFNTDNKCYEPKQELNAEKDLNAYVAKHFDVYNYDIKKSSPSESNVDMCKKKALSENKSLFLVGNASVNVANQSATYDCLIPKKDKIYTTGNIDNLLKPFNDLINDLFGNNQLFRNIETPTTIEFDSAKRQSTDIDLPSCFSIDQDNIKDTFSKSGRFVIYKTELVDNSNITDKLRGSKSYEFYKNDFNSISQNTDGILERFRLMFKSAICEGKITNSINFDNSIIRLKQHYDVYFTSLDNISTDLSNLSVITNYETLYLEKLQRDIDAKKKQLKNLIGFDGANNGKLSDTVFLKNLKISENILLFLVLIFVVYVYRRKLI
jgi:hypothetical protein